MSTKRKGTENQISSVDTDKKVKPNEGATAAAAAAASGVILARKVNKTREPKFKVGDFGYTRYDDNSFAMRKVRLVKCIPVTRAGVTDYYNWVCQPIYSLEFTTPENNIQKIYETSDMQFNDIDRRLLSSNRSSPGYDKAYMEEKRRRGDSDEDDDSNDADPDDNKNDVDVTGTTTVDAKSPSGFGIHAGPKGDTKDDRKKSEQTIPTETPTDAGADDKSADTTTDDKSDSKDNMKNDEQTIPYEMFTVTSLKTIRGCRYGGKEWYGTNTYLIPVSTMNAIPHVREKIIHASAPRCGDCPCPSRTINVHNTWPYTIKELFPNCEYNGRIPDKARIVHFEEIVYVTQSY